VTEPEFADEGDAGYCVFVRVEIYEGELEWNVPLVVWVGGMISSFLMILFQGNVPNSAG
jgi:hypothetical protein